MEVLGFVSTVVISFRLITFRDREFWGKILRFYSGNHDLVISLDITHKNVFIEILKRPFFFFKRPGLSHKKKKTKKTRKKNKRRIIPSWLHPSASY